MCFGRSKDVKARSLELFIMVMFVSLILVYTVPATRVKFKVKYYRQRVTSSSSSVIKK